MNITRTLCNERAGHADGSGSNQPDAQQVASRAAGGGGHGASSGVGNGSTEMREHETVETNASLTRQDSTTTPKAESVMEGPSRSTQNQEVMNARNKELPWSDGDKIEAKGLGETESEQGDIIETGT